MAQSKGVNQLIEEIIDKIDVGGGTKWENEMRSVSTGIHDALANRSYSASKTAVNEKFTEYCNWIKSILAIYNFGKLDTKQSLMEAGVPESDSRYAEVEKRFADDIKVIKTGIKHILAQIDNFGYYIALPQFGFTECKEIFGVDDEKSNKVVPITFSVTTVFTALVYFRRACKRLPEFYDSDDADLKEGGELYNSVVAAVAQIMMLFADYSKFNKCAGWGFTLDPKVTQAATLSDTYAVVDAISRYEDAFRQDDEVKKDKRFTDDVDAYAVEYYKSSGKPCPYKSLSKYCAKVMYNVAYNVYIRTHDKGVYGEGVFYANYSTKLAQERKNIVDYDYRLTSYEQIASSNRSSALFNPLYVAMITMNGYNDKEIVIRRFMDDRDLVGKYYARYETEFKPQEGKISLSHYATVLRGFKPVDPEKDAEGYSEYLKKYKEEVEKFHSDVKEILLVKNENADGDTDSEVWKARYDAARVFQKYLETQEPDELMTIAEYRDYLNATKDAIDQVQVMYRRFDNSQRLGIVDTDYVMFSELDVATGDDSISISKLNKANIAVNNLRPMLLSSKILIVNALTKYPQADMQELYNAIINSRHRTNVSKKRNEDGTRKKDAEWLWNEDTVDMNSTARHCETIMYDYFDYFERYELGFRAIKNLKKSLRGVVTQSVNAEGSLDINLDKYDGFERLLLALTRSNVELVKGVYQKRLSDKDLKHDKTLKEKSEEYDNARAALIKERNDANERIEIIKDRHKQEIESLRSSLQIGDTMRVWIREEIDRYLKEMLTMIIYNTLNGGQPSDEFTLDMLFSLYDDGFTGKIDGVAELDERLRREYEEDAEGASARYNPLFRKAIAFKRLFDFAFDGIIDKESFTSLKDDAKMDKAYWNRKRKRNDDVEFAPYGQTEDNKDNNEE